MPQGKDVELKGHADAVDQLCWDPTQPDQLATACGDKTVKVWDTRSGKCTTTMNTPGENINITWSPDGKTIAVGNRVSRHPNSPRRHCRTATLESVASP